MAGNFKGVSEFRAGVSRCVDTGIGCRRAPVWLHMCVFFYNIFLRSVMVNDF